MLLAMSCVYEHTISSAHILCNSASVCLIALYQMSSSGRKSCLAQATRLDAALARSCSAIIGQAHVQTWVAGQNEGC